MIDWHIAENRIAYHDHFEDSTKHTHTHTHTHTYIHTLRTDHDRSRSGTREETVHQGLANIRHIQIIEEFLSLFFV